MFMSHIQVTCNIEEGIERDMLIAKLSNEGYDCFEEKEAELIASIDAAIFDETALKAATENISYSLTEIAPQNWNAVWEADFQPVVVERFCRVRAGFHPQVNDTQYEIVITPKMSFGTGHHATTKMMITAMQSIDFLEKRVFDFGTGTGILAILAKKLGAAYVFANDNDEWAVPNALENAINNSCEIEIKQGALEDFVHQPYDIILANINKNVLLQYMSDMSSLLSVNGHLLLSGILEEDIESISTSALANGLKLLHTNYLNGWVTILFSKF
jgi:ribosomal protein L11 methyltransferase